MCAFVYFLNCIYSYEQVSTMGTLKLMNYSDLVIVITEIVQSCSKSFHHPLLAPLKAAFGWVVYICKSLSQSLLITNNVAFLWVIWKPIPPFPSPSLTSIDSAFGRLVKKFPSFVHHIRKYITSLLWDIICVSYIIIFDPCLYSYWHTTCSKYSTIDMQCK